MAEHERIFSQINQLKDRIFRKKEQLNAIINEHERTKVNKEINKLNKQLSKLYSKVCYEQNDTGDNTEESFSDSEIY